MSDDDKIIINYRDEDDKRIIEMPQTVDIRHHIEVKGQIINLLKNTDNHIILDMKDTDFIDSSGISIIIMLFNLLGNEERKLFILNADGMVKETLNISKLYKYIELL